MKLEWVGQFPAGTFVAAAGATVAASPGESAPQGRQAAIEVGQVHSQIWPAASERSAYLINQGSISHA